MADEIQTCKRCQEPVDAQTLQLCWAEGACSHVKALQRHVGLCCDCFDLSNGAPIEWINGERERRGKKLLPPWLDAQDPTAAGSS